MISSGDVDIYLAGCEFPVRIITHYTKTAVGNGTVSWNIRNCSRVVDRTDPHSGLVFWQSKNEH